MNPIVKVIDVAYVRLQAPDLDKMQTFLTDFGMVCQSRNDRALYMRGTDPYGCVHVTERGDDARFLGFSFKARDEDLARLSQHFGVPIEPNPEVVGGRRVIIRDPNGLRVEVLAGENAVPALPGVARDPDNQAASRVRVNRGVRRPNGPSHVKRLGHVVINVLDFPISLKFYQETFGLLVSDFVDIPIDGRNTHVAAFMRCDRGSTATDHHTVFLIQGKGTVSLHHMAFEVQDFDDLSIGNRHLTVRGHRHMWGPGRHTLGSQLFDYWRDPWGHGIEHWTDGDLMTADFETGVHDQPMELLDGLWGPLAPHDFGETKPE